MSDATKTCPRCGKLAPASATFCDNCGFHKPAPSRPNQIRTLWSSIGFDWRLGTKVFLLAIGSMALFVALASQFDSTPQPPAPPAAIAYTEPPEPPVQAPRVIVVDGNGNERPASPEEASEVQRALGGPFSGSPDDLDSRPRDQHVSGYVNSHGTYVHSYMRRSGR